MGGPGLRAEVGGGELGGGAVVVREGGGVGQWEGAGEERR